MKTLYLIRHAKSSWTFDLNDHARPLGKRGRKDVMKMGQYLKEHVKPPEVIVTSTASRAFYTGLYLADGWGLNESKIQLESELYHAGISDMFKVIKRLKGVDRAAIIGHNPGFTDMAIKLTDDWIDNIPTCGVMGIEFNISSWSDVHTIKGNQVFFHYPKGIGKS